MRVAGFVLVGGRSKRMGRDKARLALDSHLLVEDVAAKVSCVAENLALVGESHRYSDLGFECLDDLRPSLGPLAGIEAALASERGELNIIVACDMPGLQCEWLAQLLAHAQERNAPCVVCQDVSGQIQPLCGVWRKECLPAVQRALALRHLCLLDLLHDVKAQTVALAQPVANVNTPQEWAAWLGDPAADSPEPRRKVVAPS